LNFDHFLVKNVKLEKSVEPRVVQYVIEMYDELVVKLFNSGVTNADVRWPLSVFLLSTKNIISFAPEKRDSSSHGSSSN
jgi:hypothetical protein